ncbi:MAG: (Na+)-NQR maturation NqrM [Kiloniellales bacterium]|nr:(Na+)-NQR maturation NqrM [Kiloniellales bacterium]
MLLQTIAFAFVVLLLVVAGMAVGVILAGRRITGSCGGLSAISGAERCGICGRDPREGGQSDCVGPEPKSRV